MILLYQEKEYIAEPPNFESKNSSNLAWKSKTLPTYNKVLCNGYNKGKYFLKVEKYLQKKKLVYNNNAHPFTG